MGTLDAVSLRTDNEKPTADQLNELLEELIVLFNGGLPASAMTWPMVAEGALDMAGHPILNAASLGGAIRVNEDQTLLQAVTAVNSAGGGVILVDANYTANTSTSPLVITADNVSILGYGRSSNIHCVDLVAPGVSIKVTGNNFVMRDIGVTCATSITNMTEMISLEGVVGYLVDGVHFDTPQVAGLKLGTGAAISHNGMVTRVSGEDAVASFISIGGIRLATIAQCVFDEAGTTAIVLPVTDTCTQLSISSNIFLSSGGASAIEGGPTVVNGSLASLTISGNIISCGSNLALDAGLFQQYTISGNTIQGNVAYAGTKSSLTGNVLIGDIEVDEADAAIVSNNYISGTFSIVDTTCTACTLSGNNIVDTVVFPATSGFDIVTGNRCSGAFTALTSSDVEVYDNNYAVGGTT